MANTENFNEQMANLQQEFADYQAQAKEYEETLEKELSEKEEKLAEYLEKYTISQTNLETLTKKYQRNETEIIKLQLEIENFKRKIKTYEDQKLELEHLNDQWEKSARILEYSKQALEEKLYQAEENAILYKEELEELSQIKMVEVQRLKDECQELKQELFTIEISPPPIRNKQRSPSTALKRTVESTITISRPQSKKPSRKQSSEDGTSTQSVKVLVVFRPTLPSETWDKQALIIDTTSILLKEKFKDTKIFEFEKIILPDAPKNSVFEEIKEGVEKIALGGNACIMAYGQTGSGKTFTMNFLIDSTLSKLSEIITDEYQVLLQCIEVYNEQVKNLLNDDPLSKNWKEVLSNSEINLKNNWKDNAWDLVQKAISRRTTKFTECNERSSRSHSIICLTIVGPAGVGKIQFVDLAGSERIGKSQAAGEILKEALLINKSLSALQDVVSALENRQKHIPYRNSMLTQILQPTLGGSESWVTMIMNCSPSVDSMNETLCTLALGSRVKSVDLGFFIRKNLLNKEVERTLTLLEKERSEKNGLLRTLDKLQRDLESYQIALKDRDSKISTLKKKVKIRDNPYEPIGKQRLTAGNIKKEKSRYEEKEIRIGSMSPKMSPLSSPSSKKVSRIPTILNLKIEKKKFK